MNKEILNSVSVIIKEYFDNNEFSELIELYQRVIESLRYKYDKKQSELFSLEEFERYIIETGDLYDFDKKDNIVIYRKINEKDLTLFEQYQSLYSFKVVIECRIDYLRINHINLSDNIKTMKELLQTNEYSSNNITHLFIFDSEISKSIIYIHNNRSIVIESFVNTDSDAFYDILDYFNHSPLKNEKMEETILLSPQLSATLGLYAKLRSVLYEILKEIRIVISNIKIVNCKM